MDTARSRTPTHGTKKIFGSFRLPAGAVLPLPGPRTGSAPVAVPVPAVPPSSQRLLLPQLLHEYARAHPEQVAVAGTRGGLSFAELDQGAGRLASVLAGAGVGAESCVGVYTEPSLDLMTAVWGVLYAGAGFLPLSPEYPADRLRYMIEDSGTRVIVTQDHLAAELAELAPAGTRIVSVSVAGDRDGSVVGPVVTGPQALAYVIYTSGSTGRPKGVVVEHRAIASQMRWMHSCGHLGEGTVVLQKTPMSFDAAVWEILAPAVGSRVVMGPPGVYRDPEALVATVTAHQVTTLQCVPTLLQALLDTEELGRCTSLRRVFSGGEALPRQLARELLAQLPWCSLVNLYGPTECTINATAHLVDAETVGTDAGTVAIGVPVDNTQCFILDPDLAPVGIGTTGELYIGGAQLARGYLHRPEQTRERFVDSPFVPTERLYRTGDLALWNADGTIQFAGRADNQVKLRGYRVELDEIAVAVQEHTWVRRAAVTVVDDTRTGFQDLVACVELNPKEAALMDQGNHGGHHQSKASKLQVKAQLSNPGVRGDADLAGLEVVDLPGREESAEQRREVFARKTYRFYEGGDKVTLADLEALLAPPAATGISRDPAGLEAGEWGQLLRWFGQFHSRERLLPKYAYASPGALYATQLYVETTGLAGVPGGLYYYHPVDHTLVRLGDHHDDHGGAGAGAGVGTGVGAGTGTGVGADGSVVRVHFAGRRSAIEPVYKNNILEVLEFEAGHMVGVFESVLPRYGLGIAAVGVLAGVKERLRVEQEDHYLGTFEVRAADAVVRADPTEVYVQAHPDRVVGMSAGQYRYHQGRLLPLSPELVQSRHVIAINQQVYARAGFGVTAVSRAEQPWLSYITLGTKLHHLQSNGLGLGFMSAGYSSKSGNPLPAARRVDDILAAAGIEPGPSYFFLGGRVSAEQVASEGMYEDTVHMKGPAEMIKEELAAFLPDYMIPNRVLVLDRLPLTANGKVDTKALAALPQVTAVGEGRPFRAPQSDTERWLAQAWGRALKYQEVSLDDEFFAAGGNSLTAVALVNRINREFGTRLPLQVLFESPTLVDLAARIQDHSGAPASRLVQLHDPADADPDPAGAGPVFCWPGLGGYPMNLRGLARQAGAGRPFYGVQAYGINAGETPYATIGEMAAVDVAEILRRQPQGPYTLWGYSFGARVAFEAAWQLEQSGAQVAELLLICPGNPRVHGHGAGPGSRDASYANPAYLTILFSVFAGSIQGPDLERCLEQVRDEDGFVSFVHALMPDLDPELVRRITRIVGQTYEFEYSFRELADRRLNAPVTVFRAVGDDYSFIEGRTGWSASAPLVVDLAGDHYGVLKPHGVGELAEAIHARAHR